MSGALVIRAAIHAALSADAGLLALVNQISDRTPARASAPWLMLGDGVATGWGARDVDGVTLRQPIRLDVRGDDFAHVTAIMARLGAVLDQMDADLGDWRLTSLRPERTRAARRPGAWRIEVDYLVRAARQH